MNLQQQWSLQLLGGQTVWIGDSSTVPNAAQISAFLQTQPDLTEIEKDLNLSNLASQILLSAPPKGISILLSTLSCFFCRNSSNQIDLSLLLGKPKTKTICGYVFKKGDLVWTCQSCGKDQTCVLCDKCFRDSNHVGHEVYFHRSTVRPHRPERLYSMLLLHSQSQVCGTFIRVAVAVATVGILRPGVLLAIALSTE